MQEVAISKNASLEEDFSDSKNQPESVAAVLKVFAIMQALSEQNVIGVTELSVRLAMPKATVYRFLQTMLTLGYVQQENESDRYRLTMKVFELGSKALSQTDLVEVAKDHIRMLSDVSGETVHLGSLIESEIIYLHKVDSKHMLGMYSRIGRRAPLHCTAIGKVLLAWENPERRDRIMQGMDYKKFLANTITNREDYLIELERTKAQGFGEDREEFNEHIRCIGVPIFDRLSQPIAGLSISFPVFRYVEADSPKYIQLLKEASNAISASLGCTKPML